MGKNPKRNRYSRRPTDLKVGRPNLVDVVLEAENKINEIYPRTSLQKIPNFSTEEGRQWVGKVAPKLRKSIVDLTNINKYPDHIVKRAIWLLQRFDNNVVLQGHPRWWISKPRRDKLL